MFSEDYPKETFHVELNNFVKSRLFAAIERILMEEYTAELLRISADDLGGLSNQKRKIEALNDFIKTMRSQYNQQSIEELNAK